MFQGRQLLTRKIENKSLREIQVGSVAMETGLEKNSLVLWEF